MSFTEEYNKKLVTAEEAAKAVKSGDWVEYGQFVTQTQDVDKALAKRKDELEDVKIRATTRATPLAVIEADPNQEVFTYNNHHFSGYDRKLQDNGSSFFIPLNYHEQPRYYRENNQLDVAILGVTPMDEKGFFNFSTSVASSRSMVDAAKTVILEVNPNLPHVYGGLNESVHISEVDYLVEVDWKPAEVPSAKASEEDKKIASLIIDRIQDGATIQL